MKKNFAAGFSLMEMLVVLLITAVVMAATAPMITKKMAKDGNNSSPWLWLGNNGTVGYNIGAKEVSAVIGASAVDSGNPRLFLKGTNNIAPLRISDGTGAFDLRSIVGSTIALTDNNINNNRSDSVAFGYNVSINDNRATAIGANATVSKDGGVAIGDNANSACSNGDNHNAGGGTAVGSGAQATGTRSVALGGSIVPRPNLVAHAVSPTRPANAIASGRDAIAIGTSSGASGDSSVAIGFGASGAVNSVAIGLSASSAANGVAIGLSASSAASGVAIGANASVSDNSSVAIGNGATSSNANEVVLGNANSTVIIPGNLVVNKNVNLAKDSGRVRIRTQDGGDKQIWESGALDPTGYSLKVGGPCDRRLKNVGEVYKGGLEELKKLELFHYTYKKDPDKIKHVGVMAQDLQKIFPDAVIKGEDGFLRIRLEDMFYALVNAVKELDSRVSYNAKRIADLENQNAELAKTVSEQKEQITEQKEQIARLEIRFEELEKKLK